MCIFVKYFSRCYDEQCTARKGARLFHLLRVLWRRVGFPQGKEITPAEIVFQFRRYDLYNSQRSRYLSVNLRGIPIALGANDEVSMLIPWAPVEIVTILLILNDFYIHIDIQKIIVRNILDHYKFLIDLPIYRHLQTFR